MLLALILIVLAALLILYVDKRTRNYEGIRKIPGPPTLPIIGNALDLGTNTVDLFKNLTELFQKYGPIFKLWIGPYLTIFLAEPKYMEQILAEYDTERTDLHRLVKGIFGNGIGSSAGQRWKKQRRMLAPLFNNNAVAVFVKLFHKNADILVNQLKALPEDESVDITEYIWEFSFNSICNATMQLNVVEKGKYISAMQWMLQNAVERNFSFIKRFDCFYRFTSNYQKEQHNVQLLNDLTNSAIANHKQNLHENREDKDLNFVDHLLMMSSEDQSLTEDDIRDQLKTFILAGMDTAASTLQFAVFELAKHPEIQTKILEETLSILGKDKHTDITYDNLEKFVYTECVCKEVLRRYTPVHVIERKLKNPIILGEHTIPPETTVIVFLNALHNSKKYFSQPEIFSPDRFLPENSTKLLPEAFVPFGRGPRICLGRKYGLTEVKLMLSRIIRNFELIAVEPEHELKLSMAGSLKSANGFPIKLKRRET